MSDSFGCDPSWSQAIVSDDAPLPTVPVIDLRQAAVVDAPAGSRGKLPKQWALDETMLALKHLALLKASFDVGKYQMLSNLKKFELVCRNITAEDPSFGYSLRCTCRTGLLPNVQLSAQMGYPRPAAHQPPARVPATEGHRRQLQRAAGVV